jgi:hypothetical protein
MTLQTMAADEQEEDGGQLAAALANRIASLEASLLGPSAHLPLPVF